MPPRRLHFRLPSRTPTPSDDEPSPLSRSFLGGEPTEQPTNFGALDFEQLWRIPATEPEPEQEQQTPETTDTQESFASAPELSEPTERLFNTLLEQRNPEENQRNGYRR